MITITSPREIEKMNEAGTLLANIHIGLRDLIKPGIDSWEIEKFTTQYCADHGAIPSEKDVDGYHYATCISINDEVAHMAPQKGRLLKNGDLVKVDMTVSLDGYQADSCWAYAVGDVSDDVKRLMDVTKKSLYLGIDQAVIGNRIGDIGAAIQDFVETQHHMGDVRDLIGHGIGTEMHEEPDVPAYGEAGHGIRLREGMVITIEPMVNLGTFELADKIDKDNWEYYVSADGSLSCQYEHTLAITKDGPKILTSQDPEFDTKYLLK